MFVAVCDQLLGTSTLFLLKENLPFFVGDRSRADLPLDLVVGRHTLPGKLTRKLQSCLYLLPCFRGISDRGAVIRGHYFVATHWHSSSYHSFK